MSKEFQSLLILSTGRTGTKFLASTLQSILPDAAVYHEGGEKSRLINILSHAQMLNLIPERMPMIGWEKAILPALKHAQENKSFYIDANNHLYIFGIKNKHLYPSLKVVHIVRDPRDYVRSHLNWSRSRFKSFIANYLTPFWQPTAVSMGGMARKEWLRLNKMEKFAWVWMFKNRYIQQLEQSDTPYLRVRFEDLFYGEDPGSVLSKILALINVQVSGDLNHHFSRTINASKATIQSWPSWSSDTCRTIHSICGEMMTHYGYGGEPDWIRRCSLG